MTSDSRELLKKLLMDLLKKHTNSEDGQLFISSKIKYDIFKLIQSFYPEEVDKLMEQLEVPLEERW